MGTLGSVSDMTGRYKDNRNLCKQNRERMMRIREKQLRIEMKPTDSDISLGKLEHIKEMTIEKKAKDRKRLFTVKMKILLYSIILSIFICLLP